MAFNALSYDWQAPFRDAARRPPAPKRFTLEDLLAMQEQFQPAPRPQPLRSVSELDQQDRRDVRQQSVIQGLAALGASLQTGDFRYAGEGAGAVAGLQQQALDTANARAERDWQTQQEQNAAAIQREQQTARKAALFGVYEKIAAAEPPGSKLTEQAEAAARAGSMAELQGLLGQVPKRQAARSKGYDPDAWDTAERMQQELAAELDRQKTAASEAAELERMKKEAQIKQEAEIAQQEALRERGLGLYKPPDPPQYEPLERIAAREELVQSIRDKHERLRGEGASVSRIGQLSDGTWAEIHRADETHPRGWAVPIDGQPEVKGRLTSYSRDGARFVINQDRPELGALMVQEFEPGDEGAPTMEQITDARPRKATPPPPRQPTPQERAEALGLRNNLTISLERRPDQEAEALDLLRKRYPEGIGPYSIEQILAEAKAQAERRRKGRK